MPDLSNYNTLRSVLERNGFNLKKSLGQNFLIDPTVCPQMADEACADADGIIEIGPGAGVLTTELAKRAKKVVAIEIDTKLKPVLRETLAEFDNVEVVFNDVMKIDLNELIKEKFDGMKVAVCANLPYYITSPILSALLEADCFDSVTVMVQKEVAQRIAAAPGSEDYSAFTVFCQYWAEPELLFDVPAHCFLPQPKVTSAVISLRVRKERPWDIKDKDLFFRVVKASFAMRRKKLSNGLASGFSELGKAGAAEVIAMAGFPENVRGETLSIADFAKIADAIAQWRKDHV